MIMDLKKIILVTLAFYVFVTGARASQEFKYNFIENDTLAYTVKVNNKFDFHSLGNLAKLLNIEGMSQHINIVVDVSVESINPDASADIKLVFRKIVMTTVMGNRVLTDDGSSWGAVKPGSEYKVVIAPDGRVIGLSRMGPNDTEDKTQIGQVFFPIFPKGEIEKGYRWSDSLNFKFNLSREGSTEISSQITYSYIGVDIKAENGIDISEANHRFDFNMNGVSDDTSSLQISGGGYFYFDKDAGRIIELSGDFSIRGIVDLVTFGIPEGLGGSVPVIIESEIRIKLKDEL